MLFIGKKSAIIQGRSFSTMEPTDLSDVTFTPWLIKIVLQSVQQGLISPIDQEAVDLLGLASKNNSQLSIGTGAPAAPTVEGASVKYWGTMATLAAMVALAAKRTDWCIRSDTGTVWVLTTDDPTLIANWVELPKGVSAPPSMISATPIIDQAYTYIYTQTPFSTTIPNGITDFQVHSDRNVASGVIQLPAVAGLVDGLALTIGTTYDITSLTIVLNGGNFANPAVLPTQLLAGTTCKFKWYARDGANIWTRRG